MVTADRVWIQIFIVGGVLVQVLGEVLACIVHIYCQLIVVFFVKSKGNDVANLLSGSELRDDLVYVLDLL
jgi:hypothetical protein